MDIFFSDQPLFSPKILCFTNVAQSGTYSNPIKALKADLGPTKSCDHKDLTRLNAVLLEYLSPSWAENQFSKPYQIKLEEV